MVFERIPGKGLSRSRKDACNDGNGRDDDETVSVSISDVSTVKIANFSATVLLRRQMVSFIHGLEKKQTKKQNDCQDRTVCAFLPYKLTH